MENVKRDEQQRNFSEELKKHFEDVMETNVDVNWYKLQGTDERGFEVIVYLNKYDYKKYTIRYIEDASLMDYLEAIVDLDTKKEYKLHEPSAIERFMTDILSENKVEGLHIYDGQICSSQLENNYIPISDIVEIKYNAVNNILAFTINDCGDEYLYEIDLNNDTITELEGNMVLGA